MQRLQIPCKIFDFSVDYDKLSHELIDYNVSCVVAIPWHMLNISAYIKENRLEHNIQHVLLSADTASHALKRELAQNLDCKVFDHYGITEFGFAGAVECMNHEGLHLRALDLYIEIIDGNQNSVEVGQYGEIVVTTLTREAMPLLRYKTGDRGRILERKCACGSLLPCVEVVGRMSQGIQISNDKFIHFTEFQNFFYTYDKVKFADFDICLFTDRESLQKILLVGVKLGQTTNDIEQILKQVRSDFSMYFELKVYNHLSVNNTNKIEYCYLCAMEEYVDIFEQNTISQIELENFSNECSNKNAFEFILQKEEISSKTTIITAKKSVRTLCGTILK